MQPVEYDQSHRKRGKEELQKTEATLDMCKFTQRLCWRLGWTSEGLKMQDMEYGFY